MPDYVITVRRSTGWTILALMIIIGVLAVAGLGASAQSPPGSGSTTATLKVVPTMRTVTVSPGASTFAYCTRTRSRRTAYFNGASAISGRIRLSPAKDPAGFPPKISSS